LFIPPSTTETITMPGARGGTNWGGAASNPAKGMVYLIAQDFPTIYKLSLDDPLARTRGSGGGGESVFEQRCQACHGANGAGGGAGVPRIAGINARLEFAAFRQTVLGGRGEMPAFSLDNAALTALYRFLSKPEEAAAAAGQKPSGPVVASGGAPGGLEIPEATGPQYTPLGGPPYPEGIAAPKVRYYTDWGLFPDKGWVIGPPWSFVVAYDLNTGTIKWKVPFGADEKAVAAGAKNGGVIRGERHGMVVTSAGLIFANCGDGKVHAYDADTGEELWTGTLPTGSEGIPAMYEVNGRQYLIVSASTPVMPAGGYVPPGTPPPSHEINNGAYVVFALPRAAGR
jgi:quinoprotein glucose dehydrogenase